MAWRVGGVGGVGTFQTDVAVCPLESCCLVLVMLARACVSPPSSPPSSSPSSSSTCQQHRQRQSAAESAKAQTTGLLKDIRQQEQRVKRALDKGAAEVWGVKLVDDEGG